MNQSIIPIFLTLLLITQNSFAKIIKEKIEYGVSDNKMEGVLVYESTFAKTKKPGVIVVHNWMGVGDYVLMRAEQLAKLGYVAFVADIYGKGIRPQNAKEAGALAGKYKAGDRKELRERAVAAYETLKAQKVVDAGKISAIGYCFGGTVALDMARVGLPLRGAVSFHGGLASTGSDDAKRIQSKLLILHGAIDPHVPQAEVLQFLKESDAAKLNYEFISYSGAVHAFTEKEAGSDITKGAAYNEQADKRSFISLQNFLTEVNQ